MVIKEKVKVTGVPETMSPLFVKHIKRFRVKRYLIVMVQKSFMYTGLQALYIIKDFLVMIY